MYDVWQLPLRQNVLMNKIWKYSLLFLLFFAVNISFSQGGNGKIKVRKISQNIIGKTMTLFDLREKQCGTITVKSGNKCIINFRLDSNEIKYLKLIPFAIPVTEKFEGSYSFVSDTSFEVKFKNYTDTCSFLFLNENSNAAKLKNTPYGIFDKDNFAVFYHFDSVVYSQSYKQSFADRRFTDSVLKIDTIYKFVRDKSKRERLTKALKERLNEHKSKIKSEFFRGEYIIKGVKILLSENQKPPFGCLLFTRDSAQVSVFSRHHFEKSFVLTSEYTHKTYGKIQFHYNKCYINYYDPKTKVERFKATEFKILKKDTLGVNYLKKGNPIIFTKTDTFEIKNTEYFDNSKIKDVIGGYYSTHLLALNGNKISFKNFYFETETAVEMQDKEIVTPTVTWKYKVQNDVLFLYNNKDTLIDEMKNGFESFSFTYRNNEPYVFGAYHFKHKKSKNHEFLLLFPDQTGIKYSSKEFDYKTARESIFKNNIALRKGEKSMRFKYSATAEFLWIEYADGNYERLDFFNFNKAIRKGKNRYYLLGSTEKRKK